MAVKRIQSAARVLTVLETIAKHQPLGVSELSRLLEDDKSAIQRAIVTLADEGWICQTSKSPIKWELTNRIQGVARAAYDSSHIRHRARPFLIALRDEFDETALLTVIEGHMLILADVAESTRLLRYVPPIGMTIDPRDSAAGRALLPHMSDEEQRQLLGGKLDADLAEVYANSRKNGFALSQGLLSSETASIASAVLDERGKPVAALVVSGPVARFTPDRQQQIAARITVVAKALSSYVTARPSA